MNRAVLLIGVSRTGGLPALQAVESSIDKMFDWARAQGIPDDQIVRRTDATSPVTIAELFNDIKALADRDTIEQLIVYFSGHGVVNNRLEYWLLSDAPVNAAAAVNIEGNMTLARAGAFEHVVFLSDACRTPVQGVQYGRIIGSDIFPNIEDVERERSVDVFFATALGAPALEVAQANLSRQYQAVFTEALLDALHGRVPEAISDGRVRPRPLKKALPKKVSEKLRASGLSVATSQTPDARITSEDEAWLADIPPPPVVAAPPPGDGVVGAPAPASGAPPPPAFEPPPVVPPAPAPPAPAPMPSAGGTRSGAPARMPARPRMPAPSPPPPPPPPPEATQPLSTREVAQLVMEEALHTNTYDRSPTTPEDIRARTGRDLTENAGRLLEAMASTKERRPQPIPDRPGFQIHGRALADARCPDGACHLGTEGDAATVSVETAARQSQVLLEFDDGTGVLLPVIDGFVGVLRFHERGLDEVWYEPANDFDASVGRQEVEFLRQAILKASALGVFALDSGDADQLASHMQNLKFQDPALAVYAAYAYHDIGQFRRIAQMQEFLKAQLDVQLYDLALLSRALLRDESLAATLSPRLPMLSQGWALVGALRGRIPRELEDLRAELRPSLWSLYSPEGVQAIRAWMAKLHQEATLTTTGAVS